MGYFQNQLRGENKIVIYFPWTLITLIAVITLKANSELDDIKQEGKGIERQPCHVPEIGCCWF